ncbi:cyanophycinase [Massilia sp. R798]|uniref:Cyanophycinase n=2 Tax=Massilia soli TaxID=2792854 RepID=A0ABS7SP06_9BURK|nr:cyanophycinase [Massilia soli]
MGERNGHLVIIGGAEDRIYGKKILARFTELAGGSQADIVVITAASGLSDQMWEVYRQAFGELGVINVSHVEISSRADANSERTVGMLSRADGIFMTGGDQKRLLALIGGTEADRALHAAFRQRGAIIGGTSAGASAMSGQMLASGAAVPQPEKGAVSMAAGLGLLQHILIDQHFSERHRLGRLLTAVAQNPCLHGVGIDEDTALVIERGVGIEVVGEGAVTVVDGRHMHSNLAHIADRENPEMIDVRLHVLPAGSRYALPTGGRADALPASMLDFLRKVINPHPHA